MFDSLPQKDNMQDTRYNKVKVTISQRKKIEKLKQITQFFCLFFVFLFFVFK